MQYAETARAVAAVMIVFVVPIVAGTLAFRRVQFARATAAAWSMAANSLALVLLCLLLRASGVGVFRESFLAVWLAWIAALLFILWRRGGVGRELRDLTARWGAGLAVGLVAVVVGLVMFAPEHFQQCFIGDGTEASDLAAGLKHHSLPYWEIEAIGRFGTYVVNPTWINSHWTLAVQLLLGENEMATRLSCWVWWFGVFAISLRMTSNGGWRAVTTAIPLALSLLLVSVWYTFYTGYFPHMADVAAPAVPDAMFTMQLLLALDCLLRGDRAGWVVSMLLCSVILYAGPVMFVLIVAAALVFRPVQRGPMLRAAAAGVVGLVLIGCLYLASGWFNNSISGWWVTWRIEYFDEYFAPVPRWRSGLLFFGYFLLGCGVVPAVALLRVFRRGKPDDQWVAWERVVATVTLAYLLIIMGSGYKNLHYLGPIVPLPLILWLRQFRPAVAVPAATVCLAISLFLCWPISRPLFTLNRELGQATTFQTDSYEEATQFGRIAEELYDRGLLGWQVSQHTWAGYSQLSSEPADRRPFLITSGDAPDVEYQLLYESPQGVKFFSRDKEIAQRYAEQRPPSGAERFPGVFQPIAIPARPRRP